jgi:hypothetical protein
MGLKIKFYWPFAIINGIVWLMFLVLIILFITLPTDESNSCNGRRPIEQDQTAQEVVKIIFFITLMAVASTLLLGLIIFGKFIFRAFANTNTVTKVRLSLKRKEGREGAKEECLTLLLHQPFRSFLWHS